MKRRHLDGAAAMGPAVRQAAAGANGEAGGAARSSEFCDPTQRVGGDGNCCCVHRFMLLECESRILSRGLDGLDFPLGYEPMCI